MAPLPAREAVFERDMTGAQSWGSEGAHGPAGARRRGVKPDFAIGLDEAPLVKVKSNVTKEDATTLPIDSGRDHFARWAPGRPRPPRNQRALLWAWPFLGLVVLARLEATSWPPWRSWSEQRKWS